MDLKLCLTKTSWNGSQALSNKDLLEWHATELVFLPVMIAVGIMGNACVFYVYHCRWHGSTVCLVKKMLALLDLTSLIVGYPALLHLTVKPHVKDFQTVCSLAWFILGLCAVASSLVLVILAVDRYKRLCCQELTEISESCSKRLFIASIFAGAVISIPSIWVFGYDIMGLGYNNLKVVHCFIAGDRNKIAFFVWAISMSVVFLVIIVVLVVLYTLIFRSLLDFSEKHDEFNWRPYLPADDQTTQTTDSQNLFMQRTAKIFTAVTLVFFISYAPCFTILMLSLDKTAVRFHRWPTLKAIYDLAKLSPLLSNVANPVIYSFGSIRFRMEVKKIFQIDREGAPAVVK